MCVCVCVCVCGCECVLAHNINKHRISPPHAPTHSTRSAGQFNTGFYYMRSNRVVLSFLESVLKRSVTHAHTHPGRNDGPIPHTHPAAHDGPIPSHP